MFPIKEFDRRFQEILEAMDDIQDDGLADGDECEDLEELNSELEDALAFLDELDFEEAGWREDLEDTMEELDGLWESYRALAVRIPAVAPVADRFRRILDMAKNNMVE